MVVPRLKFEEQNFNIMVKFLALYSSVQDEKKVSPWALEQRFCTVILMILLHVYYLNSGQHHHHHHHDFLYTPLPPNSGAASASANSYYGGDDAASGLGVDVDLASTSSSSYRKRFAKSLCSVLLVGAVLLVIFAVLGIVAVAVYLGSKWLQSWPSFKALVNPLELFHKTTLFITNWFCL